MGIIPLIRQILLHGSRKPYTNPFPSSPPIPVPEGFRGKIQYNREECIACQLCIRVCPAGVFHFNKEDRNLELWISRCIFCAQCVEACPKGVLSMSNEFLLADYSKVADQFIINHREPSESLGPHSPQPPSPQG